MGINSGKYKIENNQIVNIATGIAVPEEEPVFILRAQDIVAADTIDFYVDMCDNADHIAAAEKVRLEFVQWRVNNITRVKQPD